MWDDFTAKPDYECIYSFYPVNSISGVRRLTSRLLNNGHVTYVHSKFLLCDPLGEHPIVVTSSANFSKNYTIYNDENMVIIKGDKRTADIYFTEFNRFFNH